MVTLDRYRPTKRWAHGGGQTDLRRTRVAAELTQRSHVGDSTPRRDHAGTALELPVSTGAIHQSHPVQFTTEPLDTAQFAAETLSTEPFTAEPLDTSATAVIPAATYRPIAEPPTLTGMYGVSRRIKRLTETREIRVRTTHKRRKFVARGGVLAGFGLAMVVYPIMGNVVEYHNDAVGQVPGVVLGQTPETGHALLGDGPALVPTVLDLPTLAEQSKVYTVADTGYIASLVLPDCVLPVSFDGELNGQLPADHLCLLPDGINYLRADAAQNFAQMNEQFKEDFGRNICLQEGYRSFADQIRIKAKRGWLAASPGTSLHGFGVAFDLCGGDDTGSPRDWLVTNAAAYGFENPEWAKFRKYEPWHWEYKPATDEMGYYTDWESVEGFNDGSVDPSAAPVATTPPATNPTPAPTAAAVAP